MEQDWGSLTYGEALRRTARRVPERTALVGMGTRTSFAELDRAADELAHGLRGLGVERGDQVALWVTNCPEWVVCWMACTRVGAVLVPINTRFKPDEVEYILRQSDARVLIAMDRYWDIDFLGMIRALVPGVEFVERPRLSTLRHTGPRKITRLPRRSANRPKNHDPMGRVMNVTAKIA